MKKKHVEKKWAVRVGDENPYFMLCHEAWPDHIAIYDYRALAKNRVTEKYHHVVRVEIREL